MRKIENDKRGLSAIIALALMVCVTLVLAGTLYVMVIGFGSGGASYSPTMPDENYYQPRILRL